MKYISLLFFATLCMLRLSTEINEIGFEFQAEFSEINLAGYSESGTVVDIQVTRNGTKVVR